MINKKNSKNHISEHRKLYFRKQRSMNNYDTCKIFTNLHPVG